MGSRAIRRCAGVGARVAGGVADSMRARLCNDPSFKVEAINVSYILNSRLIIRRLPCVRRFEDIQTTVSLIYSRRFFVKSSWRRCVVKRRRCTILWCTDINKGGDGPTLGVNEYQQRRRQFHFGGERTKTKTKGATGDLVNFNRSLNHGHVQNHVDGVRAPWAP